MVRERVLDDKSPRNAGEQRGLYEGNKNTPYSANAKLSPNAAWSALFAVLRVYSQNVGLDDSSQ